MDELIAKLRILTRTELTLAKIHGRRWATQAFAFVAAVLLGLGAIAMINLAAFAALEQSYGTTNAALVMAAGDVVLAGLLAFWASRLRPGPEEALVVEIQEMVLAQLQADANAVGQDITQIRNALTGSPGLIGLAGLVPLIGFAVDLLKQRREGGGEESDD